MWWHGYGYWGGPWMFGPFMMIVVLLMRSGHVFHDARHDGAQLVKRSVAGNPQRTLCAR